jgi:hypothetical protein
MASGGAPYNVGNNMTNQSGNSDRGGLVYADYGDSPKDMGGNAVPMRVKNGQVGRKPDRQAGQADYDTTAHIIPRYVNLSTTDVQLGNGLRNRVAAGLRIPYSGTGYLYSVMPIIPGQTRDNVAGFHKKGPSPLNVQSMWEAGPGSQPANPGGPGKIMAPQFFNPMSG